MIKALIALLSLSLIACSHQQVTTQAGTSAETTNVLSKGGVSVAPDGTIYAFGDSSEAAVHLGEFGKALLRAQLIALGIEAAQGVATEVTQTVSKAVQ